MNKTLEILKKSSQIEENHIHICLEELRQNGFKGTIHITDKLFSERPLLFDMEI